MPFSTPSHSCAQVCLDLRLRKGSGFFVNPGITCRINTARYAWVVEKCPSPHSYIRLTSFRLRRRFPGWRITWCFFFSLRTLCKTICESIFECFAPGWKQNLFGYELKSSPVSALVLNYLLLESNHILKKLTIWFSSSAKLLMLWLNLHIWHKTMINEN